MKLSQDAAGQPVDLSNCDREPVHIPGRVQPHGVLLALAEPGLIVAVASANCGEWLGRPVDAILGRGVAELFDPADARVLHDWLRSPDPREAGPIPLSAGGRRFDAAAHRHDGVLILELENSRPATEPAPAPVDYSRFVQTAMTRLQAAAGLAEFCRIAAAEARALTGFDRVTVYKFDADWNGEVFGEEHRAGLEPLLGLHFPASDIPEPVRRLYLSNRTRLIGDANAAGVPLVPDPHPVTGRPLDLSFAALRGASPIHSQYLRNMGVRTSLSFALIRDGRLWGLISCLHYAGPRYVPRAVRDAGEFLATLVSVQLGMKEDSEGFEARARLQAVRDRLLHRMAEEPDLVRALPGNDLLALTGASGAAVAHAGEVAVVGRTPPEAAVKQLVQWLRAHADGDVFATDSLPRHYPNGGAIRDAAAGLVAITTAKAQGHYVLWFRPEVVQTVTWGGDPTKPVGGRTADGNLSPRRSFEKWKEEVREKSLPWRPWEVDAARGLRDAILSVVVRRAEELTRLNAELERSNSDLDAFAFVTSHDLKEPLRGISNYATFVMEDYVDKLDADGVAKLRTLVRLSGRMEDLVESLLEFSRLGRAELVRQPVDLNAVLAETLDLLRVTLERDGVEVRVPRPLPTVPCDRVQVALLLNNLLTNAVKYNDKPRRWVEVGYTDPVPSAADPDGPPPATVFYVRDNGIGIPEKHHAAVFRMFKRLHGRDKFGGGTGAGLAFVKKVVDRHGGGVWLDSAPGVGTTFYFTLGC